MAAIQIVVTNVFGPLNRGDHELFNTLLTLVKRPNTQISAIARDPELCAKFFPEVEFYEQLGKATTGAVVFQLLKRVIYLTIAVISIYFPLLSYCLPQSQRSAIKKIEAADLVISCPGGFLEDSSSSLYAQLVQLLVPVLLNRKLVLAPMSIGPISQSLPKKILKFILNRTDQIYVREGISKDFCQTLEIDSILSNDLAFLNIEQLSKREAEETNNSPEFITATVINWNFPSSDNPTFEKQKYSEKIINILSSLHQKTRLPVRLIVQVESDLPAIEIIKSGLSVPCEVLYDIDTPEAIKEILDKSFCLIASRFHSAIFSLCIACPVIALSYLPKTTGMLELYGLSELCYPIESFDADQVSNLLLHMGNHRSKFAEKSAKLKSNIEKVGNPFIDYINTFLQDYEA
jgi:colanic acid/amylovoran biosynthesis protein